MISTAKGGFVYWVDCNTGNNASTFVNAGKRRYINSRVFPTFQKSSKISIDVLSTYFISQDIIGF